MNNLLIVLTALGELVVVLAAFYAGYHYRKLMDAVKALQSAPGAVMKAVSKPKPNATLIDPDDPVARAKWEMEERQRLAREAASQPRNEP